MMGARVYGKAKGIRCVAGCEGLWEGEGGMVRDRVPEVMGRRRE